MKTILIIAAGTAAMLVVVGALANELGAFCQEVNPYGPEDYPRGDVGQDF